MQEFLQEFSSVMAKHFESLNIASEKQQQQQQQPVVAATGPRPSPHINPVKSEEDLKVEKALSNPEGWVLA